MPDRDYANCLDDAQRFNREFQQISKPRKDFSEKDMRDIAKRFSELAALDQNHEDLFRLYSEGSKFIQYMINNSVGDEHHTKHWTLDSIKRLEESDCKIESYPSGSHH